MGIFNYNGKIYKFLEKFWNVVWISVLWIVCSIPIVTIGASSCAAYYSMVKSVRKNEDRATRDFFKSFKQNFVQATIMTVVYLIVGAAFAVATWFYYHREGEFNLGLRWFFYILILVYLCTITHAFSWLSRYTMTTVHALTYPIVITLMHLGNSLGLIVFWAACAIVLYWSYNTFLFAPLLLVMPGFKCLLDTFLIEPILKKYESIALKNEGNSDETGDSETSEENPDEASNSKTSEGNSDEAGNSETSEAGKI